MNREIKFRAWVVNSSIKEMHYPQEIEMNSADAWSLWHKLGFENAFPQKKIIEDWQKNTKWMQFTGLHDKNGKEIYEGDILGGYPHGSVQVKWNDTWGCYESYWVEKDEDGNDVELTELFANSLKDCFNDWSVIGNIFENPELLEEK